MALLMWHGTLNQQADNVVTVLALSFIGIVSGVLGVRRGRDRGRVVSIVCLSVSGLFLAYLLVVVVFFTLTLTRMGH